MKDIQKENFIKAIAESNTKGKVCKIFNLPTNGRGYYWIDKLIQKYNCDISHFDLGRNRRKYKVINKICLLCGNKFEAREGCRKRDGKCCSRKCANILRSGKLHHNWRIPTKCLVCDNICKKNAKRFCSKQCFGKYQRLKTFEKIENGTLQYSQKGNGTNYHLKLYLATKYGHKCMMCANSEWMGKPIPLQLEHEDGNSENNDLKNLKLLCPNCHAQTPTYCGKNKGKGKRKYRMEDYYSGKKKW